MGRRGGGGRGEEEEEAVMKDPTKESLHFFAGQMHVYQSHFYS